MKMSETCPFCAPPQDRIWLDHSTGIVLWDAFPISEGHALVVPKQHVASIYDLPMESQAAMWQLVVDVRSRLQEKHQPDGFNIGLNDGVAAGQTVMHAHIHVIPRWDDDVPDPRGGIRWVIPEKARYWGDE
jgi:diadenosine tetraphosphate (Ap4A) HIT family hydrolase